MNQIDLQRLTAPPNSWHMLRTMGGVGILCALLIVFTFQTTLPTIKKNKAEALERAVFNVLPGAETKQTFKMNADNTFEPFAGEAKGEKLVYAGYDAQNQLVGIALEAQGQGFQDAIHIIYGFSPEKQAVAGMQVLETKETPGLGDKIEKDPAFLSNFNALDVSLAENNTALKNPIEFVKKNKKKHPWQIEGITGATVSSKAIAKILHQSTEEWVPLLMSGLNQFKDKPQ
jgi:electron transport complex protein RnfG